MSLRLRVALCAAFVVLVVGVASTQPRWPFVEIAEIGRADFPVPAPSIERWIERGDVRAMRRHLWDLWAELTRTAPPGLPVFLTWYRSDEVFGIHGPALPRVFRPEFDHATQRALGKGDPIIGFNLYNGPTLRHIRDHGYHHRNVLRALIGKSDTIVDFPADSVVLKTVWWPVRGDGLTAFPVWDNDPTRPIIWGQGIKRRVALGELPATEVEHEAHGNDHETFRRLVAIDPRNGEARDVEVEFFDPADVALKKNLLRGARTVPLDRFYHFRLDDAAMVADLRTLPDLEDVTTRFWKRPLQVGDSLALIAVHLTTRETHDWVWGTWWWHDAPSRGLGADRPATVGGPFRNYRMNVSYSGTLPREADGSQHVAFNPYFEAGFSDGVHSNCVTCHQRAMLVAPKGRENSFPVTRGELQDDDPFFKNKLQLDMLWSLTSRPR